MPTMRLEHQESINRFSRLNTEKKQLEQRKRALERTVEDVEEAGNEVMLTDEETVPYLVGECFVRLPAEEVEGRLERQLEAKKEPLEAVLGRLGEVQGEMAVLKSELYGTFGNALYLEEE